MERKIAWTERASGDIEAIVRYIARRDPNAAGHIGTGIYDRVHHSRGQLTRMSYRASQMIALAIRSAGQYKRTG